MNKTKVQKDLLNRVTDIYSGALGQKWGEDDFATASLLGNVIPVLRDIFDPGNKKAWMWDARALSHFDNPQKASEIIYEQLFKL